MIVVLMGVSGSGKTTVGRSLAERLDWEFIDGDEYHPEENIERMRNGQPLSDEDRVPWLHELARLIDRTHRKDENIVLACSALSRSSQEALRHDLADVRFVCLCGPDDLIAERLQSRTDHFMDPNLLQSQIDALDPPDDALRVSIDGPPEQTADAIRRRLFDD